MKRDYELSLAELTGKPIKDIYGYISHEFGDSVFQVSRVVFVDDSSEFVEGEHDLPYIPESPTFKLPESEDE